MSDEDDFDLLHAWRGQPDEVPDELLDRRILKAAQAQRARRAALPLAAALAACLLLTVYAERQERVVAPAPAVALDTSAFGLDDGRGPAVLADLDGMDQRMIRHAPADDGNARDVPR
jgi:hypothetical protein